MNLNPTNPGRVPIATVSLPPRPARYLDSVEFTILTSDPPTPLSEVLSLKDGRLHRRAPVALGRARVQRGEATGLHMLAAVLDLLRADQAIAWGVMARDTRVAAPVDRRDFRFHAEPGVMVLEHHGAPGDPLDAEALRQHLLIACPALADAPMLWRPNPSSGVSTSTGRKLTDLTSCRLYLPVEDASLIPQAGKALVWMLWAAGFGWCEVVGDGRPVLRTLVNESVWSPGWLDFCAPSVLGEGLRRVDVTPRVFGTSYLHFDLKRVALDARTRRKAKTTVNTARNSALSEWAGRPAKPGDAPR